MDEILNIDGWHQTEPGIFKANRHPTFVREFDGDLEIEIKIDYEGYHYRYIPLEVVAELLRRAGYTVTR